MCEIQPIETEPVNKLTDADLKRITSMFEKSLTMAELSTSAKSVAKYDTEGKTKIKAVYQKAVARVRGGELKEATEKQTEAKPEQKKDK